MRRHTIARWWQEQGRVRYPQAQDLYIVARRGREQWLPGPVVAGGAAPVRQRDGVRVHVSHLPPGTSQWNYIEHRLVSFLSMNWRGRPLTTFETIVDLIGHTTMATGLTVWAE